MNAPKTLIRHVAVLVAVAVVVVMLVATGCGAAAPTPTKVPPTATPKPPTPTAAAIKAVEATPTPVPTPVKAKYSEAPMLAELVKAGKLPPVDERVSDNPLVTQPRESVGKYGGTIHTASWWPEVGNVQLYFATDAPIKWKADLTGYEAALAESYEWSDDGKTFTLHLRKGVRWSDGEPYTTADWKFWWEDMAKNEDYKVISVPGWLRKADGSPIDMEFPDAYTVVWKSDRSMWINPFYMAQGFWEFAKPMMKPFHYLKQFHPKYNASATYDDLTKMDQWWLNPDFPCVFGWCLEELSADATRYKFGRNPYFWRVDTEGNQLPYIDYIEVEIVADEEVRLLNCAQGKYDTAFRICGSPTNIPFLEERATAGGFHFLTNYMNGAGAWPGYMVNQYYVEGGKNYEDDTPEHAAEIRALLRDKRFRQALSTGFDRERIIDVAWLGIGEAKAATISPQAWHFASPEGQEVYKSWAASFAGFDAGKANAMLDEVGLVDKNGDGWRDLPSGKDFVLHMDISDWGGSLKVQTDAAAEMKNQWETNLKIKVQVNNLQGQPELDTRTNEGFYMLRAAHISEIDIWTYPDWIFPIVNRYMFPLEGRYWAKGGEKCTMVAGQPYSCGVKPEAGSPADKLQRLYEKGLQSKSIDDRHKVVWEAIQVITEEGPFVIGVAGDQPMPIIVKDHMRNILDYGVVGPWAPATPGNQIPSQWWMDIGQ